jgi:hypothetical protein
MHLILDLPLSSTSDQRDLSWYGAHTLSPIKIEVKYIIFNLLQIIE